MDAKGILQLQENFYRSLYTRDKQVENKWITVVEHIIPQDMKKEQEKPLTVHDLAIATKQLPNEKCGEMMGYLLISTKFSGER